MRAVGVTVPGTILAPAELPVSPELAVSPAEVAVSSAELAVSPAQVTLVWGGASTGAVGGDMALGQCDMGSPKCGRAQASSVGGTSVPPHW